MTPPHTEGAVNSTTVTQQPPSHTDPTSPIQQIPEGIDTSVEPLASPSFDWNTTEQYDDFQLFHKSMESWFTLQNIPVETPVDPTAEPNSTQVEYMLNFLGNTGHRKFDC